MKLSNTKKLTFTKQKETNQIRAESLTISIPTVMQLHYDHIWLLNYDVELTKITQLNIYVCVYLTIKEIFSPYSPPSRPCWVSNHTSWNSLYAPENWNCLVLHLGQEGAERWIRQLSRLPDQVNQRPKVQGVH